MGMLQLAGVVSGAGKGLQQGLNTMQGYITQSMLQQERADMEMKRLELTYGNEAGLLRERLAGQAANEAAQDQRQQANALERLDVQQGYQQDNAATDQANALARIQAQNDFTAEQADRRHQDQLAEELRKRGYEKEDAAAKAQLLLDQWNREQKAKKQQWQQDTAKEIVLETLRSQRPSASSDNAKLNPTTNAQLKILTDRINNLNEEAQNVITTDVRRQQIQKEIAQLQGQQDALVGLSSQQPSRRPFVDPMQ